MSPSERADLDGILVINKPAGVTSHDVVARVRRLLGVKRVGHGGTLDPFATGVLPVAVGRATRVLQYVQNADKRYRAGVRLGAETDTGDTEGAVTAQRPEPEATWPSRAELDATLGQFFGEIEQIPPAHSAIKVDGQPLYRRARAGEVVDVPPRTVRIMSITVLRYDAPNLDLEIACGKGTYVRALVRDIGRALGTFAYCRELQRSQTGPFTLEQSHTLEQLADADMDLRGNWRSIALAPDAALTTMPALTLDRAATNAWYHGRPVTVPVEQSAREAAHVRVYSVHGTFAGVGDLGDKQRVTPSFVMLPSQGERES
jgi:tRNA pseudouridine55 synthase